MGAKTWKRNSPGESFAARASRSPFLLILLRAIFFVGCTAALPSAIHNIEITLCKSGQLARAAGVVSKLITKEGKSTTLKLPSREVRLISKNCSATVGQVENVGVNQKNLGRAGSKRWLGKRPVVSGVIMNPVDHPHGGGEGRAPIGRKKLTTP
ncbi:putative ribosomal protein L2 [Helianthus annuus]|nr:putative ribosomal protein L2 [Helianthus annuus]KAJ0878360.1 putative ribosomal protein L2 [Helianthus annuus]KAJ0882606.1 putative ribosomal protein L2 [Helianthus annuus]